MSGSAVNLLRIDVVKKVILVAMTAKAMTLRTDRLAVSACVHIAPVYVQSIFPSFSNLVLVCFKLCFTHHLAAVRVADDSLVLDVRLHMLRGLVVQNQSLHHY